MQSAHILDRFQGSRPEIVIHETEQPIFQARLAIALVERWGMVSGAEDGEDSTGRAKGRRLTPQEVVDRACETAEKLTDAIRSRDWFTKIPEWDATLAKAAENKREGEQQEEAERIKRAADRAERK